MCGLCGEITFDGSLADSRGKFRPFSPAKRSCAATGSRLMPTRCAPTASNSADLSRTEHISFVHPPLEATG